eukprot:comp22956_c0_seq1/m.36437 comp22956_c0_seq1/g.36437  ORF comp22956_c0_seq1/g.36437 comp22956_c0_seq1/m.36437 type:complete len:441 (-) comp22956_c0_seq1:603-1925(-)
MGNSFCYVAGPNEALVVSGGLCSQEKKDFVVGGYTCICPMTTQVDRLSLEIMTVTPVCEKVETLKGVALTVTGAAQVKFLTQDEEMLHRAAEQFLGKTVAEVQNVVLQTLEGHLRAILGSLTVEEVYQDREKFAQQVREVAAPNVARMGIDILSFVIKDVSDEVDYLNSLGKKRTAEVKRDADIGVSVAEKEAGIRESEAERAHQEVKFKADTAIADSKSKYEIQKYQFAQEVNKVRADAELAYKYREAQLKQDIRKEEIQIDVVERRKQIEVEEQEIKRKKHELEATVTLPAEYERYRVEAIASGTKTKVISEAEGQAEAIRLRGKAEATAIAARGQAEAAAMMARAEAYERYGNTAVVSMALEALPKIAAELAAPLGKTEQIILLPGSTTQSTTAELTKLIAQLPPSIQAVSGVDVSKVFQKGIGSGTTTTPAPVTVR